MRPDNVVRLSLPTRRLIAEGLRRRDELIRFLSMLEDPKVGIVRSEFNGSNLSGAERSMFEQFAKDTRFTEVCRRVGVEPLAGARTIRHLTLLGAVSVSRVAKQSDDLAESDVQTQGDDAIRASIIDHLKLLDELLIPIIAVENAQGIQDRLGAVVEEASHRYPELFSGLQVGSGGAIDPDEIIGRALRYPGERDREVRLALGELVSYVEFELLNHPKIPEPEDFLESTSRLRENL